MIGAIHSSRSWLGAVAYAASGRVHAAEGKLADAERELVYAEPFFRDELSTVHHAWLLLLLARVRCQPRSPERGERGAAPCAPRARRARRLRDAAAPRVRLSSVSSTWPTPAPSRARCSSDRARQSSRCSGCWHPSCRLATSERQLFLSAEHCSDAHPRDLPEARRELSRRGGGASDRARLAGRRVITQVNCRSRSPGCGLAERCSRVRKSVLIETKEETWPRRASGPDGSGSPAG